MKFKLTFLVTVTLIILVVSQSVLYNAQYGSGDSVTFQVRTVSYGGKYAEKNIGAIWVEDSQNNFVKTLKLWAAKRIKHLIKWNAASGGNVVDAVTSATLRSHETHNVSWDCTDINGSIVADGTYMILVEFTEDDSYNSGKPPGKWISIEFTKGSSSQNITPADETYFKDMELIYTTTTMTNTSINGTVVDALTRASIENATVQLKVGNEVRYETNSNTSGEYSFNDIQAGTYQLVCSKQGYETWMEDVTLNSGQQIAGKDIFLTPLSDIYGTVREETTNTLLENATVQLKIGNEVRYETNTNVSGEYSFIDIQAGTYQLVGSKPGYITWLENVTVNPGQQIVGKDIFLTPTTDTTAPSPPKNVKVVIE